MTARLAANDSAAVPLTSAVVMPAADTLSVRRAVAFLSHGGEHAAVAAQSAEELRRFGVEVGESGTSHATGDAAASWYLIGRS